MSFFEHFKSIARRNETVSLSAAFNFRIKRGLNIYNRIAGKYKGCKIFLCPYAGTGDVYLAGMYINAFARNNGIDDFVVVVIGGSNFKVANLFGFKNIEKISQNEADMLVRLSIFLGKNDEILIMHHHPPQTYCGILENMRNFNGLNFVDLYIKSVFDLDPEKDKQLPSFDYNSNKLYSVFEEQRLVPGKTVVLSPFVNTLPSLPWWVWCNIAEKLKERGYTVCTNVGSPSEFPINGTIPLSFPYDISVPILEKCGYFIGIRSGFCDIISSAACKKIIIYQPYLFWGAGTNFDYFSLNKIGFCDDAVELEYEGVEFYDLIDKIIDSVEDK